MGVGKVNQLELVGGLLVLVLGVTNIIQLLLVGTSDPLAVALFAVYGLLFLIGSIVFFILYIKENMRVKKLIITTSSVLLLMCPISNIIFLITSSVGLDAILIGLSYVNIVLCVVAFPITFIRYAEIENMDTREKLSHLSLTILRGSGIFHLLQPLLYEVRFETLGMLGFGILYLLLAVLLTRKKEIYVIQLTGFALPLIGAMLGLGLFFMFPTPYVIVFIIFDLLISSIRLYYMRTEPSE